MNKNPSGDMLAARELAASFRENPREASLDEQAVMRLAGQDPLQRRKSGKPTQADNADLRAMLEVATHAAQGRRLYAAAPQKGAPGHCFCAQVFGPDGKAVLTVEPTADEADASRIAEVCAQALSRIEDRQLPTRDELVSLAKRCAARDPEHHDYTIDAARPYWMPHEWVLEAMRLQAISQHLVSSRPEDQDE